MPLSSRYARRSCSVTDGPTFPTYSCFIVFAATIVTGFAGVFEFGFSTLLTGDGLLKFRIGVAGVMVEVEAFIGVAGAWSGCLGACGFLTFLFATEAKETLTAAGGSSLLVGFEVFGASVVVFSTTESGIPRVAFCFVKFNRLVRTLISFSHLETVVISAATISFNS